MPLVLICGFPNSGKSAVAREIVAEVEKRVEGSPLGGVDVVSEESVGIRADQYGTSAGEKQAVGALMAAVKRNLHRNRVLVVDSMAYNRGFRYQLFCEAKEVGTTFCVVHVIAAAGDKPSHWAPALRDALVARFEEPDPAKRWDSPLFPVETPADISGVSDQLWTAISGATRRKMVQVTSAATRPSVSRGNEFVQQLDTATRAVIDEITQSSPSVSPAALQRHRRAFVALQRVRPVDVDRLQPLFREYLAKALEE